MNRALVVFLLSASIGGAQNFQPPSWGQGQGQGQGIGQGQGQGQQQQIDQLNSLIQSLQRQLPHEQGQLRRDLQNYMELLRARLERLREEQRKQSQPHVEAQTGPVVGHPVSGKETRRTTQTLTDGTEVNRSDVSYFYRDSAGRMRAEGPNKVEIFDPVAHFSYDVNPANKTYIRDAFSGNVAFVSLAAFGHENHTDISSDPADRNARGQTGVTEDFGLQTVNGVMAKGSRVTITIPAGALGNNRDIKVVNERWYSDSLQVLIRSVNNDPRFGVNDYELTNVNQSEPDASLFSPPRDYTLTTRGR